MKTKFKIGDIVRFQLTLDSVGYGIITEASFLLKYKISLFEPSPIYHHSLWIYERDLTKVSQ